MVTINIHIKSVLIGLLMVISANAQTESSDVSFKRITINDGLSLSSVYCAIQDSKGFLWFGTEDGLNKFDGKKFTIYNHTPGEANSLSNKWVESILEDKHGNIWVGSHYGLTHLDPTTNIMTQFLSNMEEEHALPNDTIITIKENGDFLWVGTKNGLCRINTHTLKSKQFPFYCAKNCNQINVLEKDSKGRTWIGTCGGIAVHIPGNDIIKCFASEIAGKGPLKIQSIFANKDTLWLGSQTALYKYILKDDKKASIKYQPIILKTKHPVENILKDSKGRIWIQTNNGLFRHKNNKLENVIEAGNPSPSLAINPKIPFIEDNLGNLWFGTFGRGLFQINQQNQIIQYQNDPTNDVSIADNNINCLLADKNGGVWIGTFGAGISIYNPNSNLFKTLKHNAFNENSMSSSFVWSIQEDKNGDLWIGTNETGINIYNKNDKSFRFLVHDPENRKSLPLGGVREIFRDKYDNMWVGTDVGGLALYNPSDNSFTTFIHDPLDSSSISDNSVRTIFQDSTGIMWVGTRHGLNRFNPKTKKFKSYLPDPSNPKSISNEFIYSSIYMDRKGDLLIGTYGGGLNRMNTHTEEFTSHHFDPADPTSISDDIVFSIYEDEKGFLWIGTNSGLNLFNPSTGKFKRYGLKSGLPNEVIYGIIPDNNKLWLTTNKGISRLDLTEFVFKNFDVSDGLQSNEFNGGAYCKGHNGIIYAGGVYGLNIIDPTTIKPETNHAQIIISGLEILGKDVQVMHRHMFQDSTDESNELIEFVDNYYLPKHVTYLDVIKLNYKQRIFSIEFAALNHLNPEKLNFRYRMKNLEDHWNYTGTRNNVTYANMKPGVYYFEVDAINSDGVLADHPAHLKINIEPPFWRSYWFIMINLIVVLLIVIFIYRFLLNQKTNKLLKDQYTEIKTANHQLQISENNLKELNATKDKFFSIISHDLKNPFASVLSISELLDNNFENTETEELKYGVKKIHTTNQHIYTLLENLLTWSKSQRNKIEVNKTCFNLSTIIDTNINLLKLSAEKKNIKIHKNYEDKLSATGDREMVSTIVRNLINNAIKFTHQGKSIYIYVTRNNNTVTTKICDEGIGISPENLLKLFSIEDKYKSDGTSGEKGTGLGLIIVKEFINKNGGKIIVTSEESKGSTFEFTIPSPNLNPRSPDEK